MRSAFLIAAAIAVCNTAHAQWIEDPTIDSVIHEGIRETYNVDFPSAMKSFQSVVKARPEHPAGYFFIAMVDWWKLLLDIDDESHDDSFFERLDKVIDVCDALLDRNESDIAGLFFKGGAIGFRGQLRAIRKSWIGAASDGKEALPVVLKAAEEAPGNADIDLGTGIYNYYAAVLPDKYPVLKPLMMFLPKGNRQKGILLLKNAAEKGRYANWEAMYFLAQALSAYENNPSQALLYAQRLHSEFPRNPVFHRNLGRLYVKLSNLTEAARVFTEVVNRVASGNFGYTMNAEREAVYYIGYDALRRKDLGTAMKNFVRCDELSRSLDKNGSSGFMTMANLRLGMAHDLLNQRAYAVKQYDKVLAMKDYLGAHDLARQYKQSPYSN